MTSLTIPVMTYLTSPDALSKSECSEANASSNTQHAASKPCFSKLLSALAASHSNCSPSIVYGLPVVMSSVRSILFRQNGHVKYRQRPPDVFRDRLGHR